MAGMSKTTGRKLEGIEHIRQSIADILTTPIGSRVMRREYGSILPELIDQPLNGATLLQAYSATALAVARWEPRVRVQRISHDIDPAQPGSVVIRLTGETREGAPVSLDLPMRLAP